MPSKKGRSEPRWLVLLEDIRSQNRATLEAVETSQVAINERIDRFEGRTESRFTVVAAALQSIGKSVVALDGRVAGLDGRVAALDPRVAGLEHRLEQSDQENRAHFSALEATLQRIDQESRSRDASLEVAMRDLKVSVQQNSVDIRDLAGKVEALSRLDERVSGLERRDA